MSDLKPPSIGAGLGSCSSTEGSPHLPLIPRTIKPLLDHVVVRREQLDASLQVSPLVALVGDEADKQHRQG